MITAPAKIYLDNCSLHRPLDNNLQFRIALEAEAVRRILNMCDDGQLLLVSSEVLELEVERNPHEDGRGYVDSVLARAKHFIAIDNGIVVKARDFENRGFKAFDALHLASAECARVNYFCTCDDRLLKRWHRQLFKRSMRVLSPIALVEEFSK